MKLQQSLQELRAEYEATLRSNKEELDGLYEQKVADLKAQLKRIQSSSQSKSDEVKSLVSRCDTLTASMTRIESERNDFLKKIKDLEARLDADHNKFTTLLMEKDGEIDRLVQEKSTLLSNYQELMDINVGQDSELATYRKFLEDEERR